MLGIAWVHLWAALDELLPHARARHAIPIFAMHNRIAPDLLWGLLHTALLLAMLVGLYRTGGNMLLVRASAAVSATIFTLLTTGFLLSAVERWPGASFLGTGVCGLTAVCAFSAVLEPDTNPVSILEVETRRAARHRQ